MKQTNTPDCGASVTLSVMISEAIYKAVVGVERIIHRIKY